MKNPTITITKDLTQSFNKMIEAVRTKETLVGIPQQKDTRTLQPGGKHEGPINNAALLYINVFGSPKQNIPPRDVMSIGIRAVKDEVAEEYRKAFSAPLEAGTAPIDQYYQRAGFIASNSIKRTINDQTGIPGPAESTLATRKSQGFKGTKSLIVTGQMRNAITFVVSQTGALKKVGS